MNGDGSPRRIAGKSSKIVALARSLSQRDARVESKKFLAEGPQSVEYGLRAQQITSLLVTEHAFEQFAGTVATAEALGVEVYQMDDRTSRSIADTRTPQGIIGIAELPEQPVGAWNEGQYRFAVMLERSQDPGNVGTVIRTADAAGADLVILGPGSADPFSPKVVRASAGSVFGIETLSCERPLTEIAVAKKSGMRVLATAADGELSLFDPDALPEFGGAVLWVLGNEAIGLDAQTISACDRTVRIPIVGQAESLNVAAAAALCLYTTTRAKEVRVP